MATVYFTDDAASDFRTAKKYARDKWGKEIRDRENAAVKAIVTAIEQNPLCGTVPKLLSALGMTDYRQLLTSYNRVIYHYDQPNDKAYILMLIPKMRDYPAHLANRMVNPPTLRNHTVNILMK